MRVVLNCLAGCTVAVSLLAGCSALLAQQADPPAGQSGSKKPGAGSKDGAPATPPKTEEAKPSTAADNPFPEEQSQAAQKEATEADRADRKAASEGSALPGARQDEGGSSSRDRLAGVDILGERESRISNGAGGTVVDPKLSSEDLKVGQQYLGLGNYQGAYERLKEACAVNPGNLEAVFYLAEAARKTAHLDESMQNYKLYLEAQPEGAKAKAAKKALAQLQGK